MRDSYHICGDTIKTYYNKVCCFYWHYYYLDATIRLIKNQTIANTQKVEVKSIKEYVNDNDFIAITPDVYANQVSRSSISIEEKQNLENQMVAATYRFYKHCIQDDKGRIFCNLTCGKNINISEELFQRKMKDIEETNKYVEKHLKAGTKYRVGKLDEKYLNSLLNYEAK